jgi:hypothetical protein
LSLNRTAAPRVLQKRGLASDRNAILGVAHRRCRVPALPESPGFEQVVNTVTHMVRAV